MAGCRIVNEGVSSAVEAINGYATSYRTAGETLITSLSSAIADMEGAAKDAFKTLIDGDINNFVATDLPEQLKVWRLFLKRTEIILKRLISRLLII